MNEIGQPVGRAVNDWTGAVLPSDIDLLQGQSCRLEALTLRHSADLWSANSTDATNKIWTYLPYGPFKDLPEYEAWY